jgi:putative transposase
LKLLERVFGMKVAFSRLMTQPRQIVAGSTYLITRRVLRRHYLLTPDAFINNLFVFFLAVLGAKYDIVFHAFCLMSTHEHLILTDIEGKLPKFLCEYHRLTALVLKVYRKWEGPAWEPDKPSVVHLQTPEAVAQAIAYVMANPTQCWAVKDAADWPGLISNPRDLWTGTWNATKPTTYLNQDSDRWPARATLSLQIPAMLTRGFANPLSVIKAEYQARLDDARQKAETEGKHFMGPERIKKVSPYQRATGWEDLRELNPTFTVGRGQHDARKLAIKAVKAFRGAYRAARELWRAGNRLVQFPAGTWWMRVFHGAPVADTG